MVNALGVLLQNNECRSRFCFRMVNALGVLASGVLLERQRRLPISAQGS
jgi:hypothetical protein